MNHQKAVTPPPPKKKKKRGNTELLLFMLKIIKTVMEDFSRESKEVDFLHYLLLLQLIIYLYVKSPWLKCWWLKTKSKILTLPMNPHPEKETFIPFWKSYSILLLDSKTKL